MLKISLKKFPKQHPQCPKVRNQHLVYPSPLIRGSRRAGEPPTERGRQTKAEPRPRKGMLFGRISEPFSVSVQGPVPEGCCALQPGAAPDRAPSLPHAAIAAARQRSVSSENSVVCTQFIKIKIMRSVLLLPLLLCCVAAAPIPTLRNLVIPSPPVYTQCNVSWASDPMGVDGPGERSTICGEGCAMSSVAMALAALGIKAPWLASSSMRLLYFV